MAVAATGYAAEPTTAAGKVGHALRLPPGKRLCLEIPHSPTLAPHPDRSLTVEAWCRPEATEGHPETQFVYSRYGGSVTYGLAIQKGGHARFFLRDSTRHKADCRSPFALKPREWVHLAGVYHAAAHRLRLFVNGHLAKELPYVPKGAFATAVPHYIGACGSLKHYHFAGLIDEVRISNTPRDIATLWAAGAYAKGLAPDPHTIALWTMEEPDVGNDTSGHGHNGVLKTERNYSGLDLPEPHIELLDSGLTPETVEKRRYLDYVRECLDTLMAHGTDRYGATHAPILVTILDVVTRTCPDDPPRSVPWRGVQRECFWKPRGSDLLSDQITLKTMYAVATITGQKRYAEFADRYITHYTSHYVDPKGFFWWGWHRFIDVFDDKMAGSHGNHHEIHNIMPLWGRLWTLAPDATRRELDAIWKWHVVDKKTGEHNRHGDGHRGCDFAMSGGEFIYALAFLHAKTGDPVYRDGAKLVAQYHWNTRNRTTDLIATRPNARKGRFDGWHSDAMIPGMLCPFQIKAFELTGDPFLRDTALAYLQAYATYGYDPEAKQFWAGLLLDGTPVPDLRGKDGYKDHGPSGHADLWEPYQLGHEHHLASAQCYAYAYQLTGKPFLLDTARKYADTIAAQLPVRTCKPGTYYYDWYARHFGRYGTVPENYGRAISFFLHLHALTKESRTLDLARRVANEAVAKLYYKGLFRGHPAKRYYGSVDGVGYLLYALTQLDQVLQATPAALRPDAIPLAKTGETIGYDNW